MRPPDLRIPCIDHQQLIRPRLRDAGGLATGAIDVSEQAAPLGIPAGSESPRDCPNRRGDPFGTSVLQCGADDEPHAFKNVARGGVTRKNGILEPVFERYHFLDSSIRQTEVVNDLSGAFHRGGCYFFPPRMIESCCRIGKHLSDTQTYHRDGVRTIAG